MSLSRRSLLKSAALPAVATSMRRFVILALLASACAQVAAADAWHFAFGESKPAAGHTAVRAEMMYDAQRGYGFEAGAEVHDAASYLTSEKPFFFSADLPEGNYNVTVTLGGTQAASTTVKAELRRLMLEGVKTAPGAVTTRTFTVNIRTPRIPTAAGVAAGAVQLKVPRETVQEAWAWDRRLTLEFNGEHPAIRAIDIAPVKTPTLFLLGDSTVCDQPGEPYSSWGQMLPRFLKPGIAVANHGESGETYRDSLARRRLDKILSAMRPGDTVLMQFGHNDQKQIKEGKGGPFTTYKDEIRAHVEAIRVHGGVPVIVSSMERRRFDDNGKVVPTLTDYANAARQSAQELRVAFIDLNAMSKSFYEALGPDKSAAAFAEPLPGKIDNTHHNSYGSYQLAQAVLTGLRQTGLPVAAYIADGYGNFDPAHPDQVATFHIPPSPNFTHQRPLGDEQNAAAQGYLFTYFIGNGEDGLHLAASDDGYRWEKLGQGRSFLKPEVGTAKLMRDPCIVRGPDGVYHMVWTTGWKENNIGYASSTDLIHWSAQRALPVMAHEAGTLNAWAPEIIYDEQHSEYLIFWASTVTGKFAQTDGSSEDKYNHRMYATTTRDFVAFTPTRLFYDPGFSVIDATFLRSNGKQYLLVKDETRNPPRKYLQIAEAPDVRGPFGKLSQPISAPGVWVEGPTAIQIGDNTIIYFDAYKDKHYGALRSRDMLHWEDVSKQMYFPDEGTPQRIRHGTVIAAPKELLDSLRKAN
ncbi:GDSL-type esterase/lipase family protein [Duganella sp. sic0402]|uniref:GDSL-type esterase/lipase family protein n=1 Tax=Duganella sp. sic0402 TaxID=2854786 RepID=UPI001E303FCB|nr:GDSL-type esterase/lipase family protein [Duganella sp. sic0402]